MKLVSTASAKTVKIRKLLVGLVMVRSTCGIQKVYRLCPGVKVVSDVFYALCNFCVSVYA